jgi:hypothetical protein
MPSPPSNVAASPVGAPRDARGASPRGRACLGDDHARVDLEQPSLRVVELAPRGRQPQEGAPDAPHRCGSGRRRRPTRRSPGRGDRGQLGGSHLGLLERCVGGHGGQTPFRRRGRRVGELELWTGGGGAPTISGRSEMALCGAATSRSWPGSHRRRRTSRARSTPGRERVLRWTAGGDPQGSSSCLSARLKAAQAPDDGDEERLIALRREARWIGERPAARLLGERHQ